MVSVGVDPEYLESNARLESQTSPKDPSWDALVMHSTGPHKHNIILVQRRMVDPIAHVLKLNERVFVSPPRACDIVRLIRSTTSTSRHSRARPPCRHRLARGGRLPVLAVTTARQSRSALGNTAAATFCTSSSTNTGQRSAVCVPGRCRAVRRESQHAGHDPYQQGARGWQACAHNAYAELDHAPDGGWVKVNCFAVSGLSFRSVQHIPFEFR